MGVMHSAAVKMHSAGARGPGHCWQLGESRAAQRQLGYLQQKPLGFRTSLPIPGRSVSLLPGVQGR
jgi:hypothetical protein